MARVKICGIRTVEAADAAAGADWIGLNFIPSSPRAVSLQEAAVIARVIPASQGLVGLFADPEDDEVAAVLDRVRLSALQLYAPPARVSDLRRRFGVPVWQARAVATAADLPGAGPGQPDAWLLDAPPPPGSENAGGNAVTMDWAVLRGWRAPAPWLLAGGLTPANVRTAIARSGADAVDVSSGVEQERGVKDPDRIRAFIAAARAA